LGEFAAVGTGNFLSLAANGIVPNSDGSRSASTSAFDLAVGLAAMGVTYLVGRIVF
jgi:hypothetical protein